ncbi:MAG: TatD family hydrolase [Rhodothermales bacterium]|nr:TatD family hydrolase [Rhodothermales bacterium]
MLIDAHCHLYHDRFESDRDAVVARARQAGVEVMVLPAIDVPSIEKALVLCDRHAGVHAMSALHPSDTKEATEADFESIATFCDDPRVVAVGESGLDYYWDRSFDADQERSFRFHIRLAMVKDLPLILHTRDKQGREEVYRDTVRILKEEAAGDRRLRGIFHCFGGPAWLADEAIELGFLLGIGGTLTFKNSGVAALVKEIPLEHLVLETDAPFLAPEPHRGQRNEPAYTRLVAERLAEVKGLTLEAIAEATTVTARRLFGI